MAATSSSSPATSPDPVVLGYDDNRARAAWVRVLLRPIGWPMFLTAAGNGLLLFYACSVPGEYFGALMLGVLLGLVLAAVWGARFLIRYVLIRAAKDPTLRLWDQWWRWAVPVGMAGVVLAAIELGLPLRLALVVSRGPLEKLVRDVAAAGTSVPDRQAGWFPASSIEPVPGGGVVFLVPGTGFILGQHGLAYLPGGLKSTLPEVAGVTPSVVRHLGGGWYEVVQTF